MSKYLEIDKTNYFQNIYFIFSNFTSLLDWAIYDIKLKFKRTSLGIAWEFANILFLSFLDRKEHKSGYSMGICKYTFFIIFNFYCFF